MSICNCDDLEQELEDELENLEVDELIEKHKDVCNKTKRNIIEIAYLKDRVTLLEKYLGILIDKDRGSHE